MSAIVKVATTGPPRKSDACFLGIPPEIRLQIYALVLATSYKNVLTTKIDLDHNKRAILRTSKHVYAEAVKVFYNVNTF